MAAHPDITSRPSCQPGTAQRSLYLPLRADEIRLIILERDMDDQLRFKFKVTRYDAEPFFALSYTWGAAEETVYVQQDTTDLDRPESPVRHAIYVDDHEVEITENLYHFLQVYRQDTVVPQEPLWIDAMCINQQDDQEKGSQVDQMHLIYSSAKSVVIWLGRANHHTPRVVTMIETFAAQFRDDAQRFASWTDPLDPEQIAKIGIPDLSLTDWSAFLSLYQRRW